MAGHTTLPHHGYDEELRRRVVNYLVHLSLRPLETISVRVSDGVVRLSGMVGSFYEKQLCLSCSRRVAGVRRIHDEIAVAA